MLTHLLQQQTGKFYFCQNAEDNFGNKPDCILSGWVHKAPPAAVAYEEVFWRGKEGFEFLWDMVLKTNLGCWCWQRALFLLLGCVSVPAELLVCSAAVRVPWFVRRNEAVVAVMVLCLGKCMLRVTFWGPNR